MTKKEHDSPVTPNPWTKRIVSAGSGLGQQLREHAHLFGPWNHDPFLWQTRAELAISRIRIVSALFAVLIPLWTVVDFAVFRWEIALSILPMRLAASAALALMAWPWRVDRSAPLAAAMLAVMLIVPATFHFGTSMVLASAEPVGAALILASFYDFLPFIALAGLSVFPLTAAEAFVMGVFVTGAMIATKLLLGDVSWSALIGPIWLLVLLTGASAIAGMSQLNFLSIMVRRVTYDPLTKALSRRAGIDLLEVKYRTATILDQSLSLAFVDLDKFKQINDEFGHDCGDNVLSQAASNMKSCLRQDDALIRWGGEEFLIVLSSASKDDAQRVLSRIRQHGLGKRPTGTPVTASFGVAERLEDGARNYSGLIESADKRMYIAKFKGRDRIVLDDNDAPGTG